MESEEFLQGFYQLSQEDQQFLKTLISDYTAGKVTDQEFTDRINAQKEKR